MYQPTDIALIIDFEATCNDDNSFPIEVMEVIEVGAVIATLAGETIAQFQTFVRPQLNPVLTIFCNQLTGIQQSDIDNAPTFREAMDNLQNFLQPYHPLKFWGSWGNYDKRQILLECQRHQIDDPLASLEHKNLKANFAKKRKIRQVGTSKALELAGLERQGTHHRALDDAINISKLISICLLE